MQWAIWKMIPIFSIKTLRNLRGALPVPRSVRAGGPIFVIVFFPFILISS